MKTEDSSQTLTRLPSPWISLVPILVLVLMLVLTIRLYGSDALGGGSQVSLLVAAAVCVALSTLVYRTPWKRFEQALGHTVSEASVSIIILLVIGMLSGSWMLSGVVPTMICYGIQIMSPRFFLFFACLICAVVSVLTGSSWTTIATIGLALLGIGNALGISEAWTAGAIISGAYFGDKISPLSDTTILASSASGTELFAHIRYMLGTTVPSILITLLIFGVAGFFLGQGGDIEADEYVSGLRGTFHISAWTLLIPLFTCVLIALRLPSLVTLFLAALAGAVGALFLQPEILAQVSGKGFSFMSMAEGTMTGLFTSTHIDTGSQALNDLVATNGMAGMLDTVWLILCAICFGAMMNASGMLQSLTSVIIRAISGRTSLVSSTVASGLLLNLTTGDQYISIILTANMFKDVYRKKGFESRLLSRTTEDAVTVTSVLVPWNSCGMTQSTVLGVATLTYLPYCFFNLISPVMSILVAATGKGIRRQSPADTAETVPAEIA